MNKPTKKIATRSSKKASAAVAAEIASVEAPVVPASEPVQAEAVPPTLASAPVPPPSKRARKGQAAEKPVDPEAEARARWRRRLDRWSKKAVAAGVDPRALMEEALAG
jgi:hypothetical protein